MWAKVGGLECRRRSLPVGWGTGSASPLAEKALLFALSKSLAFLPSSPPSLPLAALPTQLPSPPRSALLTAQAQDHPPSPRTAINAVSQTEGGSFSV